MKPAKSNDPFTGVWTFSPDRSTTSAPPPRSWVQRIDATAHDVNVREEIAGFEGVPTVVGWTYHYAVASVPFREIKRKIDAGEDAFQEQRKST